MSRLWQLAAWPSEYWQAWCRPGPVGSPVELRDRGTGQLVEAEVIDAKTGRPIDVRQIVATPGPGLPQYLVHRLQEAISTPRKGEYGIPILPALSRRCTSG